MSVKARIMAIKLMEKEKKYPDFFKEIGLAASLVKNDRREKDKATEKNLNQEV